MPHVLIPIAVGTALGAGIGGAAKGGKGAAKGALLGGLLGTGVGGLGALGGAGAGGAALGEGTAASATGAGSQLGTLLGAKNAAAIAPTIAGTTTVAPGFAGAVGAGASKALGAAASPKGQAALGLLSLLQREPGQITPATVGPGPQIARPEIPTVEATGTGGIDLEALAALLGRR